MSACLIRNTFKLSGLITTMLLISFTAFAQRPGIKFVEPLRASTHLEIAELIKLSVVTSDLPDGASMGLFLFQNLPEEEKSRTKVTEGPIIATSMVLYNNTRNDFYWNLKTFKCDPATSNKPDCAQKVVNAPYRFEAVVFRKRDVPLTLPNTFSDKDIITRAYSDEFTIKPLQENLPLKLKLQEAIKYKLMKLAAVDSFPNIDLNRFLGFEVELKGPDKDKNYCLKAGALRPFGGQLIACAPDVQTPPRVGGKVSYIESTNNYTDVKAKALKHIFTKYESRADFIDRPTSKTVKDPEMLAQATYIERDLQEWNYTYGEVGLWMFAFRVHRGGRSKDLIKYFDDTVIVLVGDQGWVCTATITKHVPGKVINLKDGVFTCQSG